MKYVSIFSVTLKSAITPSFIGLIATTLPGVRPSMSFASRPTATTSPLILLIATIEGSFTTIPLPCENTNVFAVPRSIARSEEIKLNTDLRLYPFLFITAFPLRRGSCPVGSPCRDNPRSYPPLSPDSPVHAKPVPGLPKLSRHNDRNFLLRRSAAPVRADHDNRVLPRFERFCEVPESPVERHVRHRLPVDDQRRSRLGLPDNLRHAPVNLWRFDLQDHVLRVFLRHQAELENLAELAGLFLRVGSRHVPEVISRVQPAHLCARPGHLELFHQLREHRRRADSQRVAHRACHGLPLKPDLSRLRRL